MQYFGCLLQSERQSLQRLYIASTWQWIDAGLEMLHSCTGELEYVTSIVLAVLHSISGFLSVFGNVIVLFSVYRTPSLHTLSNYYIASLALGDFLVGLVISPMWAAKSVLNIWQNQNPLTVAAEVMSMQTLIVTTFNLAAVSFDRYLAITSVFHYLQVMTIFRCIISIVFIWVFSAAFASLRSLITEPLDLPKLWIAVALVGYTLPFAVISYCYFHIYKAAKSQSRRIVAQGIHVSVGLEMTQTGHSGQSGNPVYTGHSGHPGHLVYPEHSGHPVYPGHSGQSGHPGHLVSPGYPGHLGHPVYPGHSRQPGQSVSAYVETTRNKKAANTISIVIGVYLLFASPSIVISGIQLLTTDECLKIRIIRFWYWGAFFSFCSSAVNPWIYAVRNRDFRQAFKHTFRCFTPRVNPRVIQCGSNF